jgi:hypothetical protein
MRCGALIGRGDFDCELDRDHDFGLCDKCVLEAANNDPDNRPLTAEQLKLKRVRPRHRTT